jgi:type IV pilus biogenesis protein CpaD/CtpE
VKLITALLEVFAPTSSFTTINALSFSTEIIRTLFDLGVDRVKLVPLFALLLMTYVLIIIAFGSIFGSIFSSSPRNDFQQRLTVGMVSFYGYPENVITALRFAVQHALVIDFPGMILAFSTVSVYVYIIVFQFELFVIMFLFCRLYMPYHNVFDIVDKINAVTAPLSDSGCEPADVIEVNAIPDNHRQHPLVTQATETVAYERVDSDQKLDSTRNKFKNTLTSKIDTLTAGILPVFEPRQRVEWIGSSQLVQHQSVGLTEVPANIKGFVQKRVVVVATSFGRGMGLWISHNRLATATHVLSDAVTRTAISVNKVVYWFKSLFIYNASQNVLDAACVAQLLKEPAKADDAIEPCKVAVTGPLVDITDKIGIHKSGQYNV